LNGKFLPLILGLTFIIILSISSASLPAITNSMKTIGNIARYFGLGKQVRQISEIAQRSNKVVTNEGG